MQLTLLRPPLGAGHITTMDTPAVLVGLGWVGLGWVGLVAVFYRAPGFGLEGRGMLRLGEGRAPRSLSQRDTSLFPPAVLGAAPGSFWRWENSIPDMLQSQVWVSYEGLGWRRRLGRASPVPPSSRARLRSPCSLLRGTARSPALQVLLGGVLCLAAQFLLSQGPGSLPLLGSGAAVEGPREVPALPARLSVPEPGSGTGAGQRPA